MLGRIIGFEENFLFVSLDNNDVKDLLGLLVEIKDKQKEVIGEINNIKANILTVNMLGEFVNDIFVPGIIKKPSLNSEVKLLDIDKIHKVVGIPNYNEKEDLYIGKSAIYNDINVGVNINDFFSNHFAIFGSTGSGKSCCISRLFQNLFTKKDTIAYRASIFMFDAYGEYHSAFCKLNEITPEINFKTYTTNLNSKDELLRIPLWLMSVDDIALLLNANKNTQLPIIEKALKLVSIFARDEKDVIKIKNDIIARAILDILSCGNSPAQIRDQIFSVLSYYNTKELNLESEIFQPGYTRPLKQCLIIDASGKIREMELVMSFMSTFIIDDYDLGLPDGSFKYTLDDLKDAFDFALISEGILTSTKTYDETNILKVRLHSLVSSEERRYFDYPEYIDRANYIKKLMTADNGKKAQIINFNINYIDDRLAKVITKIYSKLLFDFAKSLEKRATLPFHIVLEEAHRYVQNDNDINIIGYNIFDRITKEGRKYGVILGLISQRPSELSETALSQCSNFFIFKMLHPADVDYIKRMVPNITNETIKKLKILQAGNCIVFGSAFKLPIILKIEMPNPAPTSSSCNISKMWFIDKQ